MKLVTAAEMRRLEQAAIAAGTPEPELMEQAGLGIAQVALSRLPQPRASRVLVLVGPGNNGGDGLVVARHLHDAGCLVTLYLWRRAPDAEEANWQRCSQRGISYLSAAEDDRQSELGRLLAEAQLVVDGLLGAGLRRPVSGALEAIVTAVNGRSAARRPPVLAIDIPTGLDADLGTIWGTAIVADLTVATGLAKRGHRLGAGPAHCGDLLVVPISLPAAEEEQIMTEELELATLRSLLPARPVESHKGTFGKVMIVAGALFYPGAPVLAASAATRSGAGLVTLAVPRSIYGATAAAIHEATFLPLPEGEPGAIGENAAVEVFKHIEGYQALLVGCGLGRDEGTGRFFERLLGLKSQRTRRAVGFIPSHDDEDQTREQRRKPLGLLPHREEEQQAREHGLPALVIDADGLNLLAAIDGWHEHLQQRQAILTPHPGEMARLIGEEHSDADPVATAREAAQRWGQVVVLKGATTIVADPEGQVVINARPNAALATAGTGDVLAGLIAGLLAQGLAPFDAARLGVGVHSRAGELVRRDLGDRGVVAGDLLSRLPLAFRELAGQGDAA